MSSNNGLIYKAPTGGSSETMVNDGKHLAFEKREFDLNSIQLEEDGFITENLYVSLDPYMRGRMNAGITYTGGPSNYTIGQPIFNSGVGKVIKSRNPKFPENSIVYGLLDIAEYSHVKSQQAATFRIIQNKYNLPLTNYVGVLGMPGMTALSSLHEIGKPKKGETIFITAASGAVGQLVGQLAKLEGLYVVGAAGSDEKVNFLTQTLHFDAAFNYKTEKPLDALKKYCPKGIDIYFDNVGGEILDAVFVHANTHARIISCGMISTYNGGKPHLLGNIFNIIPKRITIQGFIVVDFWAKYQQRMDDEVE
eukprot:TRINITY_DN7287_c0_g1_i2.p1 TRINITY_DN7287_c0_g1~~TRINITY_DN7287_c0_g1_i2.p1  ORF type:complete len:308 (-),score=54.44 TRINITY_DN7287_c0_g1_i2:62-985(-)